MQQAFHRMTILATFGLHGRYLTVLAPRCMHALRLCHHPAQQYADSPKAWGPISAPPARKPSTGLPPGILHTTGTTSTLVNSSQMVSSRPCSCARVAGSGIFDSIVFAISCSCRAGSPCQ